MLIRDPIKPRPTQEEREARKEAIWARMVTMWSGQAAACEAAHVTPCQAMEWQRNDRRFGRAWEHLDEECDRDVIEKIKHRARRGDGPSMIAAFRASRGVARPWEMPPMPESGPRIWAEVQDAMICAGKRAMGLDPEDPNLGPILDFPPDLPWANGKRPDRSNRWFKGMPGGRLF